MVFFGYEPCSKAYMFYNPNTERVHISRDAVFEEGRAWSWDDVAANASNTAQGEPFTFEHVTLSAPSGGHAPQSPAPSPPTSLGPSTLAMVPP